MQDDRNSNDTNGHQPKKSDPPTHSEDQPPASAYEVVLKQVQDLQVSGRPVVDTAMLLGYVSKSKFILF